MNILDHVISDDAIIGISPLYKKIDMASTYYQLYKAFSFYFYIYTRSLRIEIPSDPFYPDHNEQSVQYRKEIEHWKAEHKRITSEVIELITKKH